MNANNSQVRLRGHHLICLHFFRGEGYSADFIENLRRLLSLALKGKEIEVTSGADDVCRFCPYLHDGKCFYEGESSEESISEMDDYALTLLKLQKGSCTKWDYLTGEIRGLLAMWSLRYCTTCSWNRVCSIEVDGHTCPK